MSVIVGLFQLLLTGAVKLLKLIASFVAFLLLKLGLWVPALFGFGYLVFCLWAKIPLGDPLGIQVLWIGMLILSVAGIVGAVYFRERKRLSDTRVVYEKPRQSRVSYLKSGKQNKKRALRERVSDGGAYDNGDGYGGGYEYGGAYDNAGGYDGRYGDERFREKYDGGYSGGYGNEPAPLNRSAAYAYGHNPLKEPAQRQAPSGRAERITRKNEIAAEPAPAPEPIDARAEQTRRILSRDESEQPLVFATRKSPDIIVLEYSDRLEFYRKPDRSGGAPELLSVEYKTTV